MVRGLSAGSLQLWVRIARHDALWTASLASSNKDELGHIASRRGLSLYLPALGGRGGTFCLEVGQGRGLPLTLAGTVL
jgi:hypothetical protein